MVLAGVHVALLRPTAEVGPSRPIQLSPLSLQYGASKASKSDHLTSVARVMLAAPIAGSPFGRFPLALRHRFDVGVDFDLELLLTRQVFGSLDIEDAARRRDRLEAELLAIASQALDIVASRGIVEERLDVRVGRSRVL